MSAATCALCYLSGDWAPVRDLWTGQAFGRGHLYENAEENKLVLSLGFVAWGFLGWPIFRRTSDDQEDTFFLDPKGSPQGHGCWHDKSYVSSERSETPRALMIVFTPIGCIVTPCNGQLS